MGRYFYKGVKQGIDSDDLFKTARADSSEVVGDKLQMNWEKELAKSRVTGKDPSLLRALVKTFIWRYMTYGVILFLQLVPLR